MENPDSSNTFAVPNPSDNSPMDNSVSSASVAPVNRTPPRIRVRSLESMSSSEDRSPLSAIINPLPLVTVRFNAPQFNDTRSLNAALFTLSENREHIPPFEIPVVVLDGEDDERASNEGPVEEMETDWEPDNEPVEAAPPSVLVSNINPSTSAATTALDTSDDCDSGSLCAICYSPYTNSGDHRITCLKCGHLFGESCIKRWLRNGCHNSNKRCPSCNSKASLREIRTIFATNIVALDTTEKDELLEKLEKLQNEKNNTDSALNAVKLKNELLTNQIREYEAKIKEMLANGIQREQNDGVQRLSNFNSKMFSSFLLCSEGACRVLAYTSQLSLLLASQASTNSLFPGYGVRKINMHDMRPTNYQNIHKKAIRDMSFSPFERGHLLSVSLDCTAKLFDTQSNIVVQAFKTPIPLWSCTWSSVDSNKFYCGSQNGTWFAFDKRQPKLEPQQTVETIDPKDKSGILSICHIPPRPGRFMPNGGVIACRLNQIVAHYPSGDGIVSKVLPIEGSFMSMEYNRRHDHLLISTKASTKWNTSRHMICQLSELTGSDNECDGIDVLQTFYGSRISNVLSRSSFVPFPNSDLTVCAYNQRNANVDLWSVVSESKLSVNDVHLPEPVLDISSFSVNDKDLIIPCLSAKKLSVIKLTFED